MPQGAARNVSGDRGTFIAAPLQDGGFLTPEGRPVSGLTGLKFDPNVVYKSQSALDQHVRSERLKVRSAQKSKNRSTSRSSSRSSTRRPSASSSASTREAAIASSSAPAVPVDDSADDGAPQKSMTRIMAVVNKNPVTVAGVSLFVLTLLATILVSLLMLRIQGSGPTLQKGGPLSVIQSIQGAGAASSEANSSGADNAQ